MFVYGLFMYFLSLIQPNIAQTVEIHMYNLC